MDNTKSTVWGAVVLLLMVVALLSARAYYLRQRDACGLQLQLMAPKLEGYAHAHGGRLPAQLNEVQQVVGDFHQYRWGIGQLPGSASAQSVALYWKRGKPVPYLWDVMPHKFVNGVHIFYTDGTVRCFEPGQPVEGAPAP